MNYKKIRNKKKNKEIFIDVYLSKSKKVRGLKRALKKIHIWKVKNILFNIENFEKEKKHHLKLSFSPFFNIFKNRVAPLWYQRVLMKALYEIYLAWAMELSKSNRKFYAKIWILKNDFMSSRLVIALDEKTENLPSFYRESPINGENSLNSFFDKFPFLDTMFIIPLLHLTKVNTIKDNISQEQLKRISRISIEKIEEKDKSITIVYPIDTILLCTH